MCGICGYLSKKYIPASTLSVMIDSMYHRGPDDYGMDVVPVKKSTDDSEWFLGMAHRRLSILDLSERGHQPMQSFDGRVRIVFNGEIYNFRELKKELEYPFASDCDTEVIIAAYLKWGIDCITHFNGMFAFALYDLEKNSLYLVRDRLGVKPLYYWKNSEGIVFSSELKAIKLYPGFSENIRVDLLPRFFVRKYIKSPDTIYENVYKLEPGTCLIIGEQTEQKFKYWDALTIYNEKNAYPVESFDESKELLREKLKEAINYRFISDVPVGIFMSGGYDSSLITAIAQSISNRQLQTFSIGFEDSNISESQYAIAISKHLGTSHTDTVINEKDMLGLIEDLPKYYDEPFADGSQLPTMLVSKAAKAGGVTVALSGDGGDEFFCGYGSYAPGVKNALRMYFSDAVRFKEVKALLSGIPKNTYANCRCDERRYSIIPDRQVRKMILDMDAYLPDDICCKVDRASMRYSLEVRSPFLDKDVVEASYRIPQKFKYYNDSGKYIIKMLAYDYIPREMLDRPKQGFGIPYFKWLHGPLKDAVYDYSQKSFIDQQGIFEYKKINDFINGYMAHKEGRSPDYSDIVWAYLMFQMWFAEYN